MATMIDTLRQEHRNSARLLHALEHQVGLFAAGGEPDYDVIIGVADYFLDYPDRCHHPKEDAVMRRLTKPRAAVDGAARLATEHRRLHEQATHFRQALTALLGDTDIPRADVVAAAHAFIDAQRRHMRDEEASLFPLAERLLTPDDWAVVEAQWSKHVDPVFGPRLEAAFASLSERLLAWEAEDEAVGGTRQQEAGDASPRRP